MKLATYPSESKNHRLDGQLMVVSKDLTCTLPAPAPIFTLQILLDHWSEYAPVLQQLSQQLNSGALLGQKFAPEKCLAPLPRAYQWVDGSAYLNHVELVRAARNVKVPASFYHDPLMYQGGSDDLLGACAPIVAAKVDFGVDFETELAVITDEVPMSCSATEALTHIRLLVLVNDVSLRNLIPDELAKGFGFLQGKPATAFGPVVITPDELGQYWHEGRADIVVQTLYNEVEFGCCLAGPDMTFHFGQLIAHLCKTRRAKAGSIVGSGTISNPGTNENGQRLWPRGCSCIAEKRSIETLLTGQAVTPYMQDGDTVLIRARLPDGDFADQLFGSIHQRVVITST